MGVNRHRLTAGRHLSAGQLVRLTQDFFIPPNPCFFGDCPGSTCPYPPELEECCQFIDELDAFGISAGTESDSVSAQDGFGLDVIFNTKNGGNNFNRFFGLGAINLLVSSHTQLFSENRKNLNDAAQEHSPTINISSNLGYARYRKNEKVHDPIPSVGYTEVKKVIGTTPRMSMGDTNPAIETLATKRNSGGIDYAFDEQVTEIKETLDPPEKDPRLTRLEDVLLNPNYNIAGGLVNDAIYSHTTGVVKTSAPFGGLQDGIVLSSTNALRQNIDVRNNGPIIVGPGGGGGNCANEGCQCKCCGNGCNNPECIQLCPTPMDHDCPNCTAPGICSTASGGSVTICCGVGPPNPCSGNPCDTGCQCSSTQGDDCSWEIDCDCGCEQTGCGDCQECIDNVCQNSCGSGESCCQGSCCSGTCCPDGSCVTDGCGCNGCPDCQTCGSDGCEPVVCPACGECQTCNTTDPGLCGQCVNECGTNESCCGGKCCPNTCCDGECCDGGDTCTEVCGCCEAGTECCGGQCSDCQCCGDTCCDDDTFCCSDDLGNNICRDLPCDCPDVFTGIQRGSEMISVKGNKVKRDLLPFGYFKHDLNLGISTGNQKIVGERDTIMSCLLEMTIAEVYGRLAFTGATPFVKPLKLSVYKLNVDVDPATANCSEYSTGNAWTSDSGRNATDRDLVAVSSITIGDDVKPLDKIHFDLTPIARQAAAGDGVMKFMIEASDWFDGDSGLVAQSDETKTPAMLLEFYQDGPERPKIQLSVNQGLSKVTDRLSAIARRRAGVGN